MGQRGARGTPRMQHLLAGAEDSEVRDTRSGADKSQRLVREAETHRRQQGIQLATARNQSQPVGAEATEELQTRPKAPPEEAKKYPHCSPHCSQPPAIASHRWDLTRSHYWQGTWETRFAAVSTHPYPAVGGRADEGTQYGSDRDRNTHRCRKRPRQDDYPG